jgi:hypothetical protein
LPSPSEPNLKTFDACATIVPFASQGTGYHDLTGQFLHTSSRGNQYLLVVYDYNSNGILHCALKNKNSLGNVIHGRLQIQGNAPNMYILDNEASNDLKKH